MSSYDDGTNVRITLTSKIHETDSAMLIEDAEGNNVWIPKSQIAHQEDKEIWIPLWLAEKKGLRYE